jgi:hypothetical protein
VFNVSCPSMLITGGSGRQRRDRLCRGGRAGLDGILGCVHAQGRGAASCIRCFSVGLSDALVYFHAGGALPRKSQIFSLHPRLWIRSHQNPGSL